MLHKIGNKTHKIGNATPPCPTGLPGDEYTGESGPPVVNTPGSLASPLVNPPGSLNHPMMNTPGSHLHSVFGTSIRTGLQKNFLVTKNRSWSKDSPVYSQGNLDSLTYFAPAGFL
jgi:hypothetical protein